MKVTGKDDSIHLENYLRQVGEKQIRGHGKTGAPPGKNTGQVLQEDKVELSTKSKQISEAKNVVTALPDVDSAKVARLRLQVSNGTYRIDAQKVANRMIDQSLLDDML